LTRETKRGEKEKKEEKREVVGNGHNRTYPLMLVRWRRTTLNFFAEHKRGRKGIQKKEKKKKEERKK